MSDTLIGARVEGRVRNVMLCNHASRQSNEPIHQYKTVNHLSDVIVRDLEM